ncbi:hypothetical protein AB0M87_29330 [Streptomyces sp. NPDC051320]|uniref:nucleotidyltransferase domain-containing protein n=1 Tax=Streptomyces sp. NPDC051320 TaxID=3154644 RepID=UPI003446EBE9
MMTAAGVHSVLAVLPAAGVDTWIAGGWGIDALVDHQTRDHRGRGRPTTATPRTSGRLPSAPATSCEESSRRRR